MTVVATIPEKQGEETRVAPEEFRAQKRDATRIWWQDDFGQWLPGEEGLALSPMLCRDVLEHMPRDRRRSAGGRAMKRNAMQECAAQRNDWPAERPEFCDRAALHIELANARREGRRAGDWIQMNSGIAFWPLDPRADEVRIEDIAHSLSLLCRFGGHCDRFYSVAVHAVHVARLVSPEAALWGLLHDASEAYVMDLPRPLKRMLPGYTLIEPPRVCRRLQRLREWSHDEENPAL